MKIDENKIVEVILFDANHVPGIKYLIIKVL
jgi:ribosomal protein S12